MTSKRNPIAKALRLLRPKRRPSGKNYNRRKVAKESRTAY
jgi:hypothetical protein